MANEATKRGLLYHIPGQQNASPEVVKSAFPHLDKPGQVNACHAGPSGQSGVIFSPAGKVFPNYKPEEQEWRCCEGGKTWIGWPKDGQPKPEDLARKKQIEGAYIELQDGNKWLIPRMKLFPFVYAFDETGAKVRSIAPAYADLYRRCESMFERYCTPEEVIDWDDILALVAAALSINYTIAECEVVALQLIGDSELFDAFKVMVSLDQWEAAKSAKVEAEKKT